MTSEQSEALARAFSVTHMFDIFLQLAPYIMLATSIIFVVLLIRVAISKITDYLSDRRVFFDSDYRDDYLDYLEREIELAQSSSDDSERRDRLKSANSEYKRVTGHYYVDPKKIND